jgi:hypothetical protein
MRRVLLALALSGCPDEADPVGEPTRCENRIHYRLGDRGHTGAFTYTDAGDVATYTEVLDSGETRVALARTYDERGRRVGQVADLQGLGPVHRVATWSYDATDRVSRVTFELDGELTTTDYEYDPAGRIARSTSRGEYSTDTRHEYRDGEPLVVVYHRDHGEVRYSIAYTYLLGRWLSRIEYLREDSSFVSTELDYEDLETGRVRTYRSHSENGGSFSSTLTWDGALLRSARHVDLDDRVQTEDFEYDERGRMLARDWRGLDFHVRTSIAWGEAGPDHIERFDAIHGQPIESWTIERGCGDLDMTLPLAPVTSWQRETIPLELGNELRVTSSFEVM